MRALSDCICHHREDSSRSQDERDDSKDEHHPSGRLNPARIICNHLLKRAHIECWRIWISISQLREDRRSDTAGVARCANDKCRRRHWNLRERYIRGRIKARIKRVRADVSNDTDDLALRFTTIATKLQVLSDRILSWPRAARQGCTDHCYGSRIARVFRRQEPPL